MFIVHASHQTTSIHVYYIDDDLVQIKTKDAELNQNLHLCIYYSTVTDFARFLGLSISHPFETAT